MEFLPGAKVSKAVMIPDHGHRRRVGGAAVMCRGLGARLPTLKCQPMPDSLGDLGQVPAPPQEALHL